ncbi:MAG: hypothetical protein AAB553_00735 [Patescibacteria group bacterium]
MHYPFFYGISVFFSALFFSFGAVAVSAHSSTEMRSVGTFDQYQVQITQNPRSPFVGEEVAVSFSITDTNGNPIPNLQGEMLVEKLQVNQYVGQEAQTETKTLHTEKVLTDSSGTVGIEYTFTEDATYDIDFQWGSDVEKESAGIEIRAREPASFFAAEELSKRIWFFIGILLVGGIAGAGVTFFLISASLHKKK